MQKWLTELMPILLEMLGDGTSGWKRRVALCTLGQLVENTGYVVHPYTQHPTLLDVLLSFLKTEQQPAVRYITIFFFNKPRMICIPVYALLYLK